MSESLFEVISTTLALILLSFMLTFVDSSANTAQLLANRIDGLEKVKYDTNVNNVTTPGTVVKGMDIVGAIRYYKGVTNTIIQVKGFGRDISYGVGANNKVYALTDFPGAGSDLNFYQANFSVMYDAYSGIQRWVYTQQ